MSTKRNSKGQFVKAEKAQSEPEFTEGQEYRVSLPAFFLWPFHAVIWVFATIVRLLILAAIVGALIAALGWYYGEPETCQPTAPPLVQGSFNA